MKSPYINYLRLSKGLSKYLDLKSHQMVLGQQYEILKEATENGAPLVFTDVVTPCEIFHAMGMSPLFLDNLASFLASVKLNNTIIQEAENSGINPDICSIHKGVIGAYGRGYLPTPQAIVHSSYWCDDMVKVCDYLSAEYNHQGLIIDVPFNLNEDSVAYVADQFKKMPEYLAESTGRKFDMDKLMEAIRYSNEARKYWIMAQKLREDSPCLMYGSDSLQMLPMLYPQLGHPKTVDILKTYYNELLERRQNNSSPVAKGKYRLLWLHYFPFYGISLMNYIEKELGAVIAFEENCNVYWDEIDENDPFTGLALKLMQHQGFGTSEHRRDATLDAVERYNIDGVIHFSHISCRPCRGSIALIREALNLRDIPFLELSGDAMDSRNYSEGQLKIRLEAFVEILQDRKN